MSAVDGTISVLKNLGTPYKVTELGRVAGCGLNDDYREGDDYPIRKLEYRDVVILEKMLRNPDCDIDDYIMSYEFVKGQEPEDWKIEETCGENND